MNVSFGLPVGWCKEWGFRWLMWTRFDIFLSGFGYSYYHDF